MLSFRNHLEAEAQKLCVFCRVTQGVWKRDPAQCSGVEDGTSGP